MADCPFCNMPEERVIWSSELVYAVRDGYPVSKGHTLVIPRRHVAEYFNATDDEKRAIWQAVDLLKTCLDKELNPDGYNVGVNVGPAAGQTIMHLHVHLIPRNVGDTDDPRGGVRGVIPDKQKY